MCIQHSFPQRDLTTSSDRFYLKSTGINSFSPAKSSTKPGRYPRDRYTVTAAA